ncbi:MAG: hypothetical protein MJE68_21575, partial [Proteobacteria bacterium]|nr:hypothetical protein [Pseudomonadota bacterium]
MTYTALKNKFLGMIDYLDETLRSVTVKKQKDRNRSKRSTFGKRPQEDEIRAIASVLDMLSELETHFSTGQNSMDRKEKDRTPFHLTVGTDRLQVENIYEDPNGVKVVHKREKRNPIVWAALGWGVYSNKRQIDKIKENIERLQTQNILQDRKIDELTRYMNLTMEKVREHDERIYSLEVQMVQLRNSLIELSYDFNYNTVVPHLLRNAQTAVNRLMVGLTAAQHNVDGILEYLHAMATHQCSPVIISPPILRKLLIKVQDRITPNPRLRLPYDIHTDIWRFYDVLRITPVVLNRLLVVLLTIPLTDQSLEMNIYRVHNLPLVSPEYKVTAQYSLEGEYLAIDKKGMYVALPTEDSIQICVMSDMGLCTMKNALYPMDMVEWCIYALYIENEEKIDKYCRYRFQNTYRNYARGLGGFLWVISAILTEKLQIRCLTDTRVVDIRPPIEIV